DQGTLVRTRVGEVSSLGRNTQGVTLIKLASDEKLVGLERVQEPSLVEGEELEGEEVVDGLVAGVIDAGVEDAGEDLQADAAADDDEPQN
ncbi:DNA gyrase C-terminal beta-propeller domain-containing protein, partial [Pseudomonas coronafaciens]